MMKSLVLVLVIAVMASCSSEPSTLHPQKRNLTHAVYASGNLFPSNEYVLKAQTSGRLVKALVDEGMEVDSGAVLFMLEPEVSSDRLQAARSSYLLAQRNAQPNAGVLAEMRANLTSAQERYQHDSITYHRYKKLFEQEATSKQKLDQASLAFQVSKQQLIAAREAYTNGQRRVKVELEQAKTNLTQADKSAQYTAPQAQFKAIIYDVFKKEGEFVAAGEPLALMGAKDKLLVQMKVDELDITQVKVGQEVLIRFDIRQDKVYKAQVSKIYPKMNTRDQSFRVDANFMEQQPESLYGLTLEANIVVNKKQDVLTIPRKLVLPGDSVRVLREGEEVLVPFTSGIRDWDFVEVVSGLDSIENLIQE